MGKAIFDEETMIQELVHESGVNPNECYQCGKCVGGCPLTSVLDLSSANIMRLLQVGRLCSVLESKTIWMCILCGMCSSRCPREIDIPKVIAYLRRMTIPNNSLSTQGEKQMVFHRATLKSIRSNGRLFRHGLLIGRPGVYRVQRDLSLNFQLFFKGKVNFLPDKIKGKKEIERIFSLTLEAGRDNK